MRADFCGVTQRKSRSVPTSYGIQGIPNWQRFPAAETPLSPNQRRQRRLKPLTSHFQPVIPMAEQAIGFETNGDPKAQNKRRAGFVSSQLAFNRQGILLGEFVSVVSAPPRKSHAFAHIDFREGNGESFQPSVVSIRSIAISRQGEVPLEASPIPAANSPNIIVFANDFHSLWTEFSKLITDRHRDVREVRRVRGGWLRDRRPGISCRGVAG